MNKHDEIKKLLNASRKMLSNDNVVQESIDIRKKYGILNEQFEKEVEIEKEVEYDNDEESDDENVTAPGDITKKINIAKSAENKIEDTVNPKKDKKQAYRISGGLLILHGKDKKDLELTTDDKIAFQETMDEFTTEVSDMVDFNKLNVFENNVEWSGKIIDFDIEFFYSIGEDNGIYINGQMIRTDEKFLEIVQKLKSYYDKFKSKWAKILSQRKKTKQ